MPGIDESKSFVPLRIAVLTVSDTRSLADDKSGATLVERIAKAGHALAARAMRQILVDHARRSGAGKRGGGAHVTDLDHALTLAAGDSQRALELDAALRSLETCDSELAQLVEWHFFAGLDFEEIAKQTHRHKRTVFSHWELARAFLQRELGAAVS